MTTHLRAADRPRGRGPGTVPLDLRSRGRRARRRSLRTLVGAVGLALVVVVAVACSGNESGGSTSSTLADPDGTEATAPAVDCYTAEQADPAGPLTVSIGAQFAIVLAAEPATGFSWQPTAPVDPEVLLTVGTEFRKAGEGCAGVTTESQVLRYVGRMPGTTQISLRYSRPTSSTPEDQIVAFTVNVVDPTTTTTPPPDTASTDTTSTTAAPKSTTTTKAKSTTTTKASSTTTTKASTTTTGP